MKRVKINQERLEHQLDKVTFYLVLGVLGVFALVVIAVMLWS